MRGGGYVSEIFVSFQGEGPHAGRRHLFVRLGGCPLRCRYCDTPESLVPTAECCILGPDGARRIPNPIEAVELDTEVRSLAALAPPLHAVAVTGGEPLLQADFVVAWLEAREQAAPPVLLETAGILPARLRRVLPWVRWVSLDFKCPSNTGEAPRWEEHEACVRETLAAGRELYVKMPVDDETSADEVARGAGLLAALAPRVPLLLTPLTEPMGTRLTASRATLDRLHDVASRIHADVRVLPQMHKVLGVP
jgi:organic radical activating enzyme